MRNPNQWIKVLLLMTFSLEIVASAFIAMYIASLFTPPLNAINGIITMLVGMVGFALGTLAFWRISVKLSRWRSASKR